MPNSAMVDVQTAIYPLLVFDISLITHLGAHPEGPIGGLPRAAVFDRVPNEFNLKTYALIGSSIEIPDNTFTENGDQELLQIDVLIEDTQDQSGWLRAKQAARRIIAILNQAELSIVNHASIFCHKENTVTRRDGDYTHIVIEFRIVTEET